MIIRIFEVVIDPKYRNGFERDFKSISVETVKSSKGLISCTIGSPSKWNSDEYTMITVWENELSLIDFAGKNWNQAVIPSGMEKYAKSFNVKHYTNMDF